jgi:hypothetical protein
VLILFLVKITPDLTTVYRSLVLFILFPNNYVIHRYDYVILYLYIKMIHEKNLIIMPFVVKQILLLMKLVYSDVNCIIFNIFHHISNCNTNWCGICDSAKNSPDHVATIFRKYGRIRKFENRKSKIRPKYGYT